MSRKHGIMRERRLCLIRNARLDPDWAQVERSTLTIADQAISSLIQIQGVGDLYRIYLPAHWDGGITTWIFHENDWFRDFPKLRTGFSPKLNW